MHYHNVAQKSPKSWSTTVRCRSKGVDFRLQADNFFPNWGTGGERISLFLHLKRIFLLDFESEFGDKKENKRKVRVKRFWGFIGRLFGGWNRGRNKKRNKKGRFVNWFREGNCNEQCQALLVPLMGTLSLLSHSSSQRDHKGITIHAFSYLFYLFILFGSIKRIQISSFFIPIIVSLLGFYSSYWNYFGIASNYSNFSWNWFFVYLVFSQLSSFSQSISLGKRKLVLLFVASIPIILYKFRRELFYQFIKVILFGSRAWISSLILTAQAFFQYIFKEKRINYAFGVLISSAYFWGKEIINHFWPFFNGYIQNLLF